MECGKALGCRGAKMTAGFSMGIENDTEYLLHENESARLHFAFAA